MVGKRTFERPRSRKENESEHVNGDIESGIKRRFPRFKDAVELAMAERTTALLKQQLRKGIDAQDFDRYRTSDEDVRV